MRLAAAALVLLAACADRVVSDCNFRNSLCPEGSFCMGHTCRLADSGEAYPFSFLVIPPDGAATTASGPLVPTPVPDPGGERRLVACPATLVKVDTSRKPMDFVALGSPYAGLGFTSVVEADSNEAPKPLPVRLPPGAWSMLARFHDPAPPASTVRQIPPCLDEDSVSLERKMLVVPATKVQVVVDAGRDDRPFCDARLAVVNAAGALRSTQEVVREPGCTDPEVLSFAAGESPLFLRVRPREPGNPTIPTQLVPLQGTSRDPLTVSAVGPAGQARRFGIVVQNGAGEPVEAEISATGIVLDGPRAWPSSELPATFTTRRADPVPRQRGSYTVDLVPGCYRFTAVPAAGSLSAIGHNRPGDLATLPAACTTGSIAGSMRVDAGTSGVEIVLPDKLTIDGTVTRGGEVAVPGTQVTAVPLRGEGREVSSVTDETGHFTLRTDTDTEYDLLVQPPVGSNLPWTRLPVKSQSRINPILPDPQWIRGSVVDPAGQPVPRTVVQAFPAPLGIAPRPIGEAVTDEDGTFTLVLPSCLQCAN